PLLTEPPAQSAQPKSAWGQPQKSRPDGDGVHIGVQHQASQQQAARPSQQFYQAQGPPQQQGPRGPPQQQGPRGPPQQQSQPQQQVWGGGPPPQQGHHPKRRSTPTTRSKRPTPTRSRRTTSTISKRSTPTRSRGPPQQGPGGPPQQSPRVSPEQGPRGAPQQQPQREQPQPQGRPQQGPSGDRRVSPPTQQVAKLQVGDLPPMQFVKHKPGVSGRKITVETNHLQLKLGNLQSAIHYDVNLVPDTPKKFLRIVVDLFRQKHFPKRYPAFDGRKNLYSTNRLPFGDFISDEIVLQESDGREKKYKVEIKFANEVDLRPLQNYELSRDTPREALQVVDIVLRSAPAVNLISVGRSFFVKPERIIDLGEGMEMYSGFYQSAIRGWKPFLNVDVAHKAFPKCINVADALVELLDSYFQRFTRDNLANSLDHRQRETFEKYIKTLRVVYEIPGNPASKRTYRVNGIDQSAREKVFSLDSGQQTTIENYFANEKRYRLRYPNLPTLWVGDRNRPNRILLPLELCNIEKDQVTNRKMTENQTSTMIKYSATSTNIRKDKIMTALNQAKHNQSHTVREFGFSIANEFEKLDARILQPPDLSYNNNRVITPTKGVWRGEKFIQGMTINKWTIAFADRRGPRPDDLNKLADMIFRTSESCGMQITTRAEQPFASMGNLADSIRSYFQKQLSKQYDVIFVVVPNSGPQYSFVKTAAEINTGCLTQCIKMRTLGKLNPQTITNILLKVNAKLNGTNHFLTTRPPIMNRPCMIMGADVTHPSPDSRDIPSVAAPPRVEIIEDLEAITLEQLKYFFEMNKGMKPERIVFFRDGVSEGQFDQVRQAEIRAIRSACKKIQANGDYQPKITFLVVQKRHHTRLFPTNPRDSDDRNNNVPAGTCVDTTITHPFMQDFYLVSHASIQGVAKPTKYCTLWDDNDMSNEEIEHLAYYLCHMFTRCNRSVSYPAPTYYAHLAAARAKVYIENTRLDLDNLPREFARFPIQDVIRKGKPMFFV
ncbi:Protein argonaute-2, partial [Gonioctena quinquepunctata]